MITNASLSIAVWLLHFVAASLRNLDRAWRVGASCYALALAAWYEVKLTLMLRVVLSGCTRDERRLVRLVALYAVQFHLALLRDSEAHDYFERLVEIHHRRAVWVRQLQRWDLPARVSLWRRGLVVQATKITYPAFWCTEEVNL